MARHRLDRRGGTDDLLLRVLCARDQIHGFHVTDVDGVAEDRGEDDFRDVSGRHADRSVPPRALRLGQAQLCGSLFLLSAVQVAVCEHHSVSKSRSVEREIGQHEVEAAAPRNFWRMWAISLLMRFSSSSLTLHARRSAMYCCSGAERTKSEGQSLRTVHLRGEAETHRETTHIIFDHLTGFRTRWRRSQGRDDAVGRPRILKWGEHASAT